MAEPTKPRGDAVLVFVAEDLPEGLRPRARLPKELASAVFYVHGSKSPLRLPGRRPGGDVTPWMNKRGAPWRATRWLQAVVGELPRAAAQRLTPGGVVSASRLRADFDRRTRAYVTKQLEALGLEVLDLHALLSAAPPPGKDGLLLECVALGGASGSYTIRWLARDRAALVEMIPWLEQPETYDPERGSACHETWGLHVVSAGQIVRRLDLQAHVTLDGQPVLAWTEGAPSRVKVDWAAMKLPRASARSVKPGEEISITGWEDLDPEDAICVPYGESSDDER
mgnify:FL=1